MQTKSRAIQSTKIIENAIQITTQQITTQDIYIQVRIVLELVTVQPKVTNEIQKSVDIQESARH